MKFLSKNWLRIEILVKKWLKIEIFIKNQVCVKKLVTNQNFGQKSKISTLFCSTFIIKFSCSIFIFQYLFTLFFLNDNNLRFGEYFHFVILMSSEVPKR